MARIAIGGFQHETNTFSPHPARLDDFVVGGGWPGMLRGAEIERITADMNLPVAGAFERLRAAGHDVVPLVWAAATPSGRVTDQAFESITSEFLRALLSQQRPIDGIYFDLHGAMATDSFDDGEGEFLRRVRQASGNTVPIVCSLDLHANLSAAMFEYTDALEAYRTYPHIDMRDTGRRAIDLLGTVLAGRAVHKCMRRVFFSLPLTAQATISGAPRELYSQLEVLIETERLISASWLGGFALADVEDVAQAVVCYSDDPDRARSAANQMIEAISAKKGEFISAPVTGSEAVKRAIAMSREATGPIIIADVQDNPGAGGSGDTTGILRDLLFHGAQNALVAMIRDPSAIRLAKKIGVGKAAEFSLGGGSAAIGGEAMHPLKESFTVEKLTDGSFVGTGPMWGGSPINLGDTALLRCEGVRVLVVSNAMQAADQSIIEHVGLRTTELAIICLKSSVHFRADFDQIAFATIVAASPGLVPCDLSRLEYKKQRR